MKNLVVACAFLSVFALHGMGTELKPVTGIPKSPRRPEVRPTFERVELGKAEGANVVSHEIKMKFDEEISGGMFYAVSEKTGYLNFIYAATTGYRGLLVTDAVKHLKELGCSQALMMVSVDKEKELRLYKKLGFEKLWPSDEVDPKAKKAKEKAEFYLLQKLIPKKETLAVELSKKEVPKKVASKELPYKKRSGRRSHRRRFSTMSSAAGKKMLQSMVFLRKVEGKR